jgi:hypothetical protein
MNIIHAYSARPPIVHGIYYWGQPIAMKTPGLRLAGGLVHHNLHYAVVSSLRASINGFTENLK